MTVMANLRRLKGLPARVGAARLVIVLSAIAALTVFAKPAPAEIQEVSGNLLDEIEAVRVNMPGRDSEGFVPPTTDELDLWRSIIESLLGENADTVDSLLAVHFPEYRIFLFTDTGYDSSEYYLVRETLPPALGWGTLIVRIDPCRKIAIEVAHPLYDINTASEGGDIFRRVGARLFIMAGTHRCANSALSPCDGSTDVCGDGHYHESDMGHVTETVYQVAHEVFTTCYRDGYSFSIHGNVRSNCEDIFLSNGHATDSQEILFELRDHMIASGNITVGIAGDGTSSCPLYGSTNVQGRYTNGSPDPCFQGVSSTTGFFIHAEQQRRVRDSLLVYSKLIDAIRDAIPAVQASVTPATGHMAGIEISVACPNPCASRARFLLSARDARRVKVEIFNPLGKRVALLYDGALIADRRILLELDAARLPSGIYFVRASGGGAVSVRTLTVVK